jgi:quinol monooxygenase YgiN
LPAHRVPLQRFDIDRTVYDIDGSFAIELNPPNHRYKVALICGRHEPMETIMKRSEVAQVTEMFSRRSAIGTFGAALAGISFSPWAISASRSEPNQGVMKMSNYAMDKKTVSDAVNGGGLLVVAQWEAKEGQGDNVAAILDRFLPEAQSDPGAKLFLIGRGKENPAQFLFYELFRDEAALKAHQESAYFKTYIADQALPLLAKRERAQYALL